MASRKGGVEMRHVPGFSAYLVAEDGSVVYSTISRKVLKFTPNKGGWLCITPRNDAGRIKSIAVHRLVALAFIGPIPPG